MTDKEIINQWKHERELAECVCSYFVDQVELSFVNETIDLINRQKAEIEKIKSEAYKKFAKKVKEEIIKAYDNNLDVFGEHLEKHKDNPDFEFLSTITGKMNTLRGLDYFIDKLLKEMVGETK